MATNYFVQASQDENGKYRGGAAGDQTKKEVAYASFYNYPWGYVAIYPDKEVRRKISKCAQEAAANNNIGYDQSGRNSLFSELQKVEFDFTKVGKCECDCSSLVHSILVAVGALDASTYTKNAFTTSSMRKVLENAGFLILTEKINAAKYCTEGAIYVSPGNHTAICIKSGSSPAVVDTDTKEDNLTSYKVGANYAIIAKWGLNVRRGPGVNYAKVPYSELSEDGKNNANAKGTLKVGTVVTCKEISVISTSEIWMRIPSGWICAMMNGDEYVA